MHRKKLWLSLPFLGSSEEPEKRIAKEHTNKPRANGRGHENGHPSGIDYELTREATAKEVAQKTEEDIVQDYNSPIHMWVSKEARSTYRAACSQPVIGSHYALSTHSRHVWSDGFDVQHLRHCHLLADSRGSDFERVYWTPYSGSSLASRREYRFSGHCNCR